MFRDILIFEHCTPIVWELGIDSVLENLGHAVVLCHPVLTVMAAVLLEHVCPATSSQCV